MSILFRAMYRWRTGIDERGARVANGFERRSPQVFNVDGAHLPVHGDGPAPLAAMHAELLARHQRVTR